MLFPVLLTIAVLAGLVIFRFYAMGDAPARHFARVEYDRMSEEGGEEVLTSVDKDTFVDIYDRLRVRRFWAHFILFFALTGVALVATLMVLNGVWRFIDPGFYVWGFIAIFAIVAVAVVCLFVTIRLYTNNLWPAMRREIEKRR